MSQDEKGRRLTLYHGTSQRYGRIRPSATGAQGPGIYMTDAPSDYGTLTLKLSVEMNNPYYFYPSDESLECDVNGELIEAVLPPMVADLVVGRLAQEGIEAYGYEVQNELRSRGHDGIIMVYPFGDAVIPRTTGSCVVIAFDSDQVEILEWHRKLPLKPGSESRFDDECFSI
jgi:hypothetical protein